MAAGVTLAVDSGRLAWAAGGGGGGSGSSTVAEVEAVVVVPSRRRGAGARVCTGWSGGLAARGAAVALERVYDASAKAAYTATVVAALIDSARRGVPP